MIALLHKEAVDLTAMAQRPHSPTESLKHSCIEMNLIREGRLVPKRDWRTMFAELGKEVGPENFDDDEPSTWSVSIYPETGRLYDHAWDMYVDEFETIECPEHNEVNSSDQD